MSHRRIEYTADILDVLANGEARAVQRQQSCFVIGKPKNRSDSFPHDFRLRKVVQISAVTKVVWGVALVGSGLDFIPKLVQMGFYGGVVVDVDAWDLAFYAVVGVDQPQSCPVVGVALDVTAS